MGMSGSIAFSRMKEVVFGTPAADALYELIERTGAKRVFLLASGTLNRNTNEVERLRAALGQRFAGLFDRIPAHSPRQSVIDAANVARECEADLIVTVGGGSVTDAGKAIRLCVANDIREAAALDALRPVGGANGKPQAPQCNAPEIGQIAIPTTLSAGDFSALSGLTDERSKTKELFWHLGMMPTAVILDPALTIHTPMDLFLSTGVRAIDHGVEGVCSNEANPYTDAQALHGITLLASGLRRVKQHPDDLDARLDCQLGAWLSMTPLANGVSMGASHGIGYVLGAAFGIPHGHTSCVMLPAVMQWNQTANAARQAMVAAAMQAPGADAAVELKQLIANLGMHTKLSDVGITSESFDMIATKAMATQWVPRNPKPIAGPQDVMQILEAAA